MYLTVVCNYTKQWWIRTYFINYISVNLSLSDHIDVSCAGLSATVDNSTCVLCGLPDGLSRLWNMNWRSWQETCHPRTSTSSPPATSSSFCWTCCSRSTLAGIVSLSLTHKHTRTHAQTHIIALYQERYPCFLLTFNSQICLWRCCVFILMPLLFV